jgi:hypothetical protein
MGVEGVDIDDRIKVFPYVAGNQWNGTTTQAHQEVSGFRSELIFGDVRLVVDRYFKFCVPV